MGCTSGKSQPTNNKRNSISIRKNSSTRQPNPNQKEMDSPELAYQFIMSLKKQQEEQYEIVQHNMKCICSADQHAECLAQCANERECYSCPRLSIPAESTLIRKRTQIASDIATRVSERDRCIS